MEWTREVQEKKEKKGFVILEWWCCAVSMATGTKACGWPLMANCILHSSFVNCCLPSSHFLLGRGTKPPTGGIRNGTSASHSPARPPSLTLSFFLSLCLFFSLHFSCPHRAIAALISSLCALLWPCQFILSFLPFPLYSLIWDFNFTSIAFWISFHFFTTLFLVISFIHTTLLLLLFQSIHCQRVSGNPANWTRQGDNERLDLEVKDKAAITPTYFVVQQISLSCWHLSFDAECSHPKWWMLDAATSVAKKTIHILCCIIISSSAMVLTL